MKRFWSNLPYLVTAFAIALVFTAATAFLDWRLATIEGVVLFLCTLLAVIRRRFLDASVIRSVRKVADTLDVANQEMIDHFPMPLLVADVSGAIIWYNELFDARVLGDEGLPDDDVTAFTGGTPLEELADLGNVPIEYNGHMYTVYSNVVQNGSKQIYALYFVDDTSLKRIAADFSKSRSAVLFLAVDNLDEIAQDFKDSDKAALTGGVEKIIENWMSQYPCLMTKTGNGRYLVVAQERHLEQMIGKRFNILDEMRSYTYGDVTGVTLSIGVGRGDTLRDCEESARQALDMALGRGGDQAAVKDKGQFEFYGGVSAGVEKRTKAKTRITASAIAELIEGSENVLIMGHRFPDLDALGAGVGVWYAAHALKKDAYIVMSRDKTLAMPLLQKMEEHGKGDIVVEPERGMELLTKKSLLVIVDTHRPDFVEFPALYHQASTAVVIDHHRKTVDYIDHAVIFYHEQYASSTSEMVTEMLQYISRKPIVDRLAAEALLAGIMLDTHNFILRTGVRTFEAAAYLRSRGADTVAVKQLFSNTMESYRIRNAIVSGADLYRSCAVSIAEADTPDIRVVAAQAADELLNISGVKASFVMYQAEEAINISARSMGEMNVQLIMESIGGGGHQTMAAVQLDHITISDARARLLEAIDRFYQTAFLLEDELNGEQEEQS